VNQARSSKETQLLILLKELQSLLTDAINSLDTKKLTPETRYLSICAITVNQAAGGYLILRGNGNVYPSKFLIRPILEATLSSGAVMKKRGFLFRKAYTELLEEKKAFPKDSKTETHFKLILNELESFFKKYDPCYPIEYKKVDIRYTSELAEMPSLYEVAYRTYCKFTHGGIDAALGQLNEMTDDLDTQFVVRLVFMMLEQLQKHTYAKIPDLSPFRTRLEILK
jgi:Family of unknown function (DUF5677)